MFFRLRYTPLELSKACFVHPKNAVFLLLSQSSDSLSDVILRLFVSLQVLARKGSHHSDQILAKEMIVCRDQERLDSIVFCATGKTR